MTPIDLDAAVGPLFERYRALARAIDRATARIRGRHPRDVHCAKGCNLCCHDFFSISILEAAVARLGFERLPPELRRKIEERVDGLDRFLVARGVGPEEGRHHAARDYAALGRTFRARESAEGTPLALCPLNVEGACSIYDHRPIVCRTFGYPIDHFFFGCPGENFGDEDAPYSSLDGTRIDGRLEELARQFVEGTALEGRVTDNRYAGVVDWLSLREGA